MQEKADISRVRNGDATPITKPEQAQAPHSNHHDPANTKGKIARNDSTGDTDYISSDRSHPREASDFGTNDNGEFMYDPGGHTPNSKDGSTRDVGDSSSSFIHATNIFDVTRTLDANAANSSSSISNNTDSIANTSRISPAPNLGNSDAIISHSADTNDNSSDSNGIPDIAASIDDIACTTNADAVIKSSSSNCKNTSTGRTISTNTNNNNSSSNFNNDATNITINVRALPISNSDLGTATNSNASNTDSGTDTSLPIRTARTTSSTDNRNIDDNANTDANSSGSNSIFDTNAADIDTTSCNSNSIPDNTASFVDSTRATNAFDDSSSSNFNSNATSIVDTARMLSTNADSINTNSSDADSIFTIGCAPSTSERLDTFDSSGADPASPICNSTVVQDNESEHEHAHTLPLAVIHQVPPFAAPHPDKPEEPPPAPPTNATSAAPNPQVVQDTRHTISDPPRAPHLFDDAASSFIATAPHFPLPADDFDNKNISNALTQEGQNLKPREV